MDIRITVRQIGRKRAALEAVTITIPEAPHTLRQLLTALARSGADGYNTRLLSGESGVRPVTDAQLADMETVGKIAFGVVYGGKRADPEKAAADALLAFTDGLFRVFQGTTELTSLDAPLELAAHDEFTFIRLTMLTGSIW